jgi:hypothetical protein
MNLNKALVCLSEGRKIKLPEWEGYWEISSLEEDGLIEVHLKTGEIVYTPDFVQYGGRDDWEVIEE